ncbi:sensor histidine kinase [Actinomadura viridis]|uniref:histidine kinase n=1 Tax=Actinomadura viridis TaxID=58110 RepID=A0A931GGC6_9ACTN|nr:sensor histidine kinase [Actinomadura viridis]MBG6086208.1 signal transduction histidine kinase [Actinomadura viridis]
MVRRFWNRCRGTLPLVDGFLAAPLFLLSLTGLVNNGYGMNCLVFMAWSLSLLLPLLLRRTFPRSVFAVVCLVSFAQVVVNVPPLVANVSVLMALYTIAAGHSFRWGLAALAVAEGGGVLAALRFVSGWEDQRYSLLTLTVIVAGVWLLGLHMRTRRAYLRSLEERAARLERERDTEVQVAMAAERARIARELHDVVAHNVSVIVVQADGASYAIDTDTGRARQALETISVTGRQALAEMRRMLGVLRESDDAGPYVPQPGVAQLTELVEQIRDAGLPLDFGVEGVPLEMSEGRQLAVFRIVQEALTNTLKHGGPRASARVLLHYGDDAIELRVTDDGRGAAAVPDGRGHGLLGMRERAAVYGGRVEAGPRPGGGFEVVALIPVREEVRR